eukprot:5282809-Pleurochrysis_carterae.AAC.2
MREVREAENSRGCGERRSTVDSRQAEVDALSRSVRFPRSRTSTPCSHARTRAKTFTAHRFL